MFYIYISCDDGTPLFLKSTVTGYNNLTVDCMDGTVTYLETMPAYEDSWLESPERATAFNDDCDAIRYVCEHHPAISNAVEVMGEYEARQYI